MLLHAAVSLFNAFLYPKLLNLGHEVWADVQSGKNERRESNSKLLEEYPECRSGADRGDGRWPSTDLFDVIAQRTGLSGLLAVHD